MKKKVIITLITVCTMLFAFDMINASAETSGTCGDNVNWLLDDSGTLIISGNGSMTNWKASRYVAYADVRDDIIRVEIKNGITSIGDYAFSNCGGLISVSIPDSITSIGNKAFYNCSNLTSVNIPDGVTNIGYYAFDDCSNLTSVNIPDGVTSVESGTFHSCYNLSSVSIPDSVTSIGDYAFSNCGGLISVSIPDGVTSIGKNVFHSCYNLSSVSIPDSVTSIGEDAFSHCSNLTSVSIGSGIEIVLEETFYSCNNLKYVVLSTEVKYIRNDAFNLCNNIETVFYDGSESQWNEILFYNNNENLINAKIVYNATKKTYKFETNCNTKLSDVTDYAIFTMPALANNGKTFAGWYDNKALSGNPITFPYYGDATTLYAAWIERTGTSFDDAIHLKENKTNIKYVDAWDYVYYDFVPQFSGQYRFYATGSNNVYINLYSQDRNYIGYTNNGEYLSYDYFEAGTVYYLSIRSDIATELSFTIETDLTIGTSSKVSQDGKSFTVTVNGIPYGKTIILALYDGNKFAGMQSATYIGNEIYFTTTEKYTNAKVMVWDNFTKLKPVCGVEIVK